MSDVDRLPACFAGFPGVVLHVSLDGVIRGSNGRLERALGQPVIGVPFASVIDTTTCGDKWDRILVIAREPNATVRCELVFARADVVEEPRSFSVLGDAESGLVWLLEHPTDPRVEEIYQQVTSVNSELVTAARELVRERARLVHALDVTERLAAQVKAQSEVLGTQNEEIVAMTDALDAQRRELERLRAELDGILEQARSLRAAQS